ncbi:MAG: carbonate dehydratase [Methylococcaceae bacterium]|nr:carbonate dehydratase [Methylococcaceae bacterium]
MAVQQRRHLKSLFKRNKDWAQGMVEKDPDFFLDLSKQQTPEYLWIGCADSRVPANQVVDLKPGQVFVHRNIANVVVHTDLNCLSVIQYAINVLQVRHIIVCGHYGCGGVRAAFEGREHGLIDNWLRHIKDVYRWHKDEIDAQPTEESKIDLLCEKNVIEQVANVCHSTIVQHAWRANQDLTVHGWIYSIENGLLKALDVEVTDTDQLSATHALKD